MPASSAGELGCAAVAADPASRRAAELHHEHAGSAAPAIAADLVASR